MENGKALKVIESYAGKGLVYARKEEIEAVSDQYESIVTVLELSPDEFIPVGEGNYYPLKSATNKISDAAGVSFTENCGTREEGNFGAVEVVKKEGILQVVGDYAVIGWAQGFRLKPDGSRRLSSVCEYVFNIIDRCNLDVFGDKKGRYTSVADIRKHLLELKKFATQRASTGAEMRVVRELVGMPTAFTQTDTRKPLILSQTVESTKFKVGIAREIMKTPDGRQAVVNALFGTTSALYGPQGGNGKATVDVTPTPQALPESTEEPPIDFEDDIPFEEAPEEKKPDPVAEAKTKLQEWLDSDYVQNPKNREGLQDLIDKDDATLEELQKVLAWLGKQFNGEGAAS